MPHTLIDRRQRHNLQVTEPAFGNGEGWSFRHCEEQSDEAIHSFFVA
jgi:hypothetical protein